MLSRMLAAFLLIFAGTLDPAEAGRVPPGNGSVELIDIAGVQEFIKEHRGEVIVINVWATWCVPCSEEIPDLIALSEEHRVRVVGVSIDDPSDSTSRIIPFLKKHKVPYPVFVKASGDDEAFINAFSKEWSGAVPATFVYDSTGTQRTMLVGKQSYGALRKAVESVGAH